MYSVQKQDFVGNWVEVYRAQMFQDAERFKKGLADGSAKMITRKIQM